jgi:hypothetical protein
MAKQEQPAPASARAFKVLHTQVGPWPMGHVVTADQLAEHNAEVQRLLDIKAIEPTDAPGTGPTPLVPDEMNRQAAARGSGTNPATTTAPGAVRTVTPPPPGPDAGSLKDAQKRGPVLP